MPQDTFKHELGKRVVLIESHETGVVIGRAEYLHTETQYWIRYMAADGRQCEQWWGESAIE